MSTCYYDLKGGEINMRILGWVLIILGLIGFISNSIGFLMSSPLIVQSGINPQLINPTANLSVVVITLAVRNRSFWYGNRVLSWVLIILGLIGFASNWEDFVLFSLLHAHTGILPHLINSAASVIVGLIGFILRRPMKLKTNSQNENITKVNLDKEIGIGESIHSNLSITSKGKAEVEDCSENDEVEDDFFGEEDDDSISPFVFCFDKFYIEDVADENGPKAARSKLLTEMSMFMGAIADCVDDEARFFIINNKEKVVEVFDRVDIEKEWGLLKDENMASWLENRKQIWLYYQIAVIIRGNSHWDDGFLRVSEYEGVAPFKTWGMYTPIGEIASQGYEDGDFDSGVAADPEDDSYYYGQSAMENYALKEIQFELATYGIDER